MKNKPRIKPLALAGAVAALHLTAVAEDAPTTAKANVVATTPPDIGALPTVTVIATTPLPGSDQDPEEIPAAVQGATGAQISDSQVSNLAEFLDRNLGAVHVNDVQGNPFQLDVNYRGFTASPLLGTPQGLSVYVDGVRMNQPFGDIVQWDLIPRGAIHDLTLMPGSNPVFGLNTLGGAISVRTKDGLTAPGTSVETGVGSHGRRSFELQTGGSNARNLNWYLLANTFHDDGWRTASPSDVNQLFGKLGWRDRETDVKLTVARAESKLQGSGFQQANMLANDYGSVFTKPDVTRNGSTLLNLEARREIARGVSATGNVYYRDTLTRTLNADLNEESIGQAVYLTSPAAGDGPALTAAGYTPVTEGTNSRTSALASWAFPKWRCIANGLSNEEPNEKCTAIVNTTRTQQKNFGLSAQLNLTDRVAVGVNDLTVGAAFDRSLSRYTQGAQFGYLNPDRSATTIGAYPDGTQSSENAFDQRVDLNSGSRTWSLFATDTLTVADVWHLTAAARYNDTRLVNRDNLYPYNNALIEANGGTELRGTLDGNHRYRRLNPAVGIAYAPSTAFNPYASYSEANRAPTSIELGCADPEFGCRLPNSMAGDPHLKQVVARTIETGVRGRADAGLRWNAALFRTESADDIMFVANSNSTGYFRNFGKTRRQGAELSVSQAFGQWAYAANYTWLDATYRSAEEFGGGYNSTAEDGIIQVAKGHKIPLIPSHLLKLRVEYRPTQALRTGLTLVGVGSSYVRGNENNRHVAGGNNGDLATTGGGKLPSYAVVHWNGSYQATDNLAVFGSIANLFDRRYYTAGALGPTAFTATGGYTNGLCTASHEGACSGSTMYTPGAPRSFWVGIRYLFDRPSRGDR